MRMTRRLGGSSRWPGSGVIDRLTACVDLLADVLGRAPLLLLETAASSALLLFVAERPTSGLMALRSRQALLAQPRRLISATSARCFDDGSLAEPRTLSARLGGESMSHKPDPEDEHDQAAVELSPAPRRVPGEERAARDGACPAPDASPAPSASALLHLPRHACRAPRVRLRVLPQLPSLRDQRGVSLVGSDPSV